MKNKIIEIRMLYLKFQFEWQKAKLMFKLRQKSDIISTIFVTTFYRDARVERSDHLSLDHLNFNQY